jgi:hypothetical protein
MNLHDIVISNFYDVTIAISDFELLLIISVLSLTLILCKIGVLKMVRFLM